MRRSYLERANRMNPSPENTSALAQFLAEPGEDKQSSEFDKKRALELQKRLAAYQAQNRNDDPYYALLVAQIAFKQDNVKEVRAAVNALAADHPDLMQTHFFLALLAAHDEDWVKAEEEIKKRRVWGCPPKPRNNSWTRAFTRAQTWRFFYYSLYLVGAWIVGQWRCLRSASFSRTSRCARSRPIRTGRPATGAKEISLRSLYKRLINVAGVYYYISLPVVIFLVLGVRGRSSTAS